MFTPLKNSGKRGQTSQSTIMMASGGMNQSIFAPFRSEQFAQLIVNYEINADGTLKRRKGRQALFVAGNKPTMAEIWTYNNKMVFQHGTNTSIYDFTTGSVTDLKTDWTTDDKVVGKPYGEYFYVMHPIDGLYQIDSALTVTNVASAPASGVMEVIGSRMYIGDEYKVVYCDQDVGSNPPFNSWTDTTLSTAGGNVSQRRSGNVVAIGSLGDMIIAFQERGKFAFYHNIIDSAGSLKKIDVPQMDRVDMGATGSVLSTTKGIFYTNGGGLFAITSVGQPNVPFSDQEVLHSGILGTDFMDDINFENSDMEYNEKNQTLYIPCSRSASANNIVLAYDLEKQAFTEIQGWSLSKILKKGNDFYGASSVNGKFYKLFHGETDDGSSIGTKFVYELKLGDLTSLHDIMDIYANGQLSTDSKIKISLSPYDRTGEKRPRLREYLWQSSGINSDRSEYGVARVGGSPIGGELDAGGLVNRFDGFSPRIRNIQRLEIEVTSADKVPHTINFISPKQKSKRKIRTRQIRKI